MIKIGILTCIHSNDVCARVGERITQIISMLEQGGIRVFLGTHRE